MCARRALAVLLLLALSACANPFVPVRKQAPARSLRILLTNDDGFDAAGITALRAALLAGGHHVTVVAPSRNRSGSSVSITTVGSLVVREVEPGVFAVDGTPADCVLVALRGGVAERVDLVVAGINFGQNIGTRIVSSGTVGAAITAAGLGVPAIASSQTVDSPDYRTTPRFFPDAAQFTALLVAGLAARGDGPLLPPGIVLNVNYPARTRAEVAGVQLTRQGRSILYALHYERGAGGSYAVSFEPAYLADPVRGADTTAIAEGYISVTPLEGNWTAPEGSVPDLGELVKKLTP
jgi:5'-nucleotidase